MALDYRVKRGQSFNKDTRATSVEVSFLIVNSKYISHILKKQFKVM